MHAEKCPVCGGSGKLPSDGRSTGFAERTCHGCGGKGWIQVQNGEREPHISVPWYPIYPAVYSVWPQITFTGTTGVYLKMY